jgi:hypothetical protein
VLYNAPALWNFITQVHYNALTLCTDITQVHYNVHVLWNSISQVHYNALALHKIQKIHSPHEKIQTFLHGSKLGWS